MATRRSLRSLRRQADLTQEQLAERAGVNRVTLSKYERGVITPSLLALQRLARALGVETFEIDIPVQQGVA